MYTNKSALSLLLLVAVVLLAGVVDAARLSHMNRLRSLARGDEGGDGTTVNTEMAADQAANNDSPSISNPDLGPRHLPPEMQDGFTSEADAAAAEEDADRTPSDLEKKMAARKYSATRQANPSARSERRVMKRPRDLVPKCPGFPFCHRTPMPFKVTPHPDDMDRSKFFHDIPGVAGSIAHEPGSTKLFTGPARGEKAGGEGSIDLSSDPIKKPEEVKEEDKKQGEEDPTAGGSTNVETSNPNGQQHNTDGSSHTANNNQNGGVHNGVQNGVQGNQAVLQTGVTESEQERIATAAANNLHSNVPIGDGLTIVGSTEKGPATIEETGCDRADEVAYLVSEGDYLLKIARAHCITVEEIVLKNRTLLKDANSLALGMDIVLPSPPAEKRTAAEGHGEGAGNVSGNLNGNPLTSTHNTATADGSSALQFH